VDNYVVNPRAYPQRMGEFSYGSYGNLIDFTKTADMVHGQEMTARTRSQAALNRDAALVRISYARRWLIAGAAGLTAGLAAFVSATAHGRTLKKGAVVAVPAPNSSSSSTTVQMPPLASPTSLGLQGPVEDPQPSSSGSAQTQSSSPSQSQAAPTPAPSSSSSAAVSGGS
jgi:hypothetical protein